MNPTLLECPFDSGRAEFQRTLSSWAYRVRCTTCWCATDWLDTRTWNAADGYLDTDPRAALAKAWNRRSA